MIFGNKWRQSGVQRRQESESVPTVETQVQSLGTHREGSLEPVRVIPNWNCEPGEMSGRRAKVRGGVSGGTEKIPVRKKVAQEEAAPSMF